MIGTRSFDRRRADAELLGGVAKLGCKLSGKLNQSVPMPGPERRSD